MSSDGSRASFPKASDPIVQAHIAAGLLHGLLASGRCRQHLEQGRAQEALVELRILCTVLQQLEGRDLTQEQARDADLLRVAASKHEAALNPSPGER